MQETASPATSRSFDQDRYMVVPNLISNEVAQVACRYARMKAQTGELLADDMQVPNTPAAYGDTLMETLLAVCLPALEAATGLQLEPTYSYYRVYKTGDVLQAHVDRPSCEVSATVCLGLDPGEVVDADYAWPIYVDNSIDYSVHPDEALVLRGGEGKAIVLRPGDALVYRGAEVKHWREAFQGLHQVQVFLHYVMRNGQFADEKFDRRPMLGAPFSSRRATSKEESSQTSYPPGLVVVENYLDGAMRTKLLNYVEQSASHRVTVGMSSNGQALSFKEDEGFMAERIELGGIKDDIVPLFNDLYRNVIKREMGIDVHWYEFPHVLRYAAGGKYEPHSDSENYDADSRTWKKGVDRDVSVIMYLNENFEGGALHFPDHDLRIQPKAGMLVCFPSDHRFIHAAEPTRSGTRYALVTWAAARDVPRVQEWPTTSVIFL